MNKIKIIKHKQEKEERRKVFCYEQMFVFDFK